jgi:hypothetical protein
MLWPTGKVSTEPHSARELDGTLLGKYYLVGGGYNINLWYNRTPQQIEEVLKTLPLIGDLSGDVLNKLSKMSYGSVKRIIHLWRGIESALTCANIELINRPICLLHKKLWRWVISSSVHNYDTTVSIWKKVCLYFVHFAGNTSSQSLNPFPHGVPGGHNGHHGRMWVQMMPWLLDIQLANMLNVDKLPKGILERVGHLVQTRMTPPPPLNHKRFEKEFESWAADLTRDPSFTDEHKSKCNFAMTYFTSFIQRDADLLSKVRPHISLSGGGCYESPRAQGGRAIYMMREFVRRYILSPGSGDEHGRTWWGAPYELTRGVPPMYTMCRRFPLDIRISPMSSSFRDPLGKNSQVMAAISEPNSEAKVEEPMFGLDRILPLQIFQMSLEMCVERGYLPGPPFKWSPIDVLTPFHRNPIPCKSLFICEAGNKVRPLSEAPGCVTVALQPLAHWLEGIIKSYPSLNSAFTRTYKGWDFTQNIMRGGKYLKGMGFSVFDLSAASNNLNTKFCRHMLQYLVSEFVTDNDTRFLLLQLGELLFAPRLIEVRRNQSDVEHRVIRTTNGLMMGDPGTKEFLCLSSAIIHLMTFAGSLIPIPRNLIAGDDVIGLMWENQHDALLEMHVFFGNKINLTKAAFSKRLAWYCEELLVLIPESIGCGKASWQVDYESCDIHVDIVKLRLLSPFSSVSMMQDELHKNPAIGKGNALLKVLSWYPRKGVKDYCMNKFIVWMSEFIRDDPLVFIPRILGGYGLPYLGDREELYERVLDRYGTAIVGIYGHLRHSLSYHGVIDFLVRRMANGMSVRGLLDPMTFLLASQFANLAFAQFQHKCKTFDQFKTELQTLKSYEVSNKDVMRYINSQKFLAYNQIADNLDRLTAMRISVGVAAGFMDLEEIIPARDEYVPNPSEVYHEFLQKEVADRVWTADFNVQTLRPSGELINEFYHWIVKDECKPWVSPQRLLWIPKEALIDSLNGMTIQLPWNPSIETDNNPVPGSIKDEDRAPGIDGSRSEMISLKRLH